MKKEIEVEKDEDAENIKSFREDLEKFKKSNIYKAIEKSPKGSKYSYMDTEDTT